MNRLLYQTLMPMLPNLNPAACENFLRITATEINKKRKELKEQSQGTYGIKFEWVDTPLVESCCTTRSIPFVQMAQVKGHVRGVIPIPGQMDFVEMNPGVNPAPVIPISPYNPFGPVVGIPLGQPATSNNNNSPPDKDTMMKYLDQYSELKKLLELYKNANAPPAAPAGAPDAPGASTATTLDKNAIFEQIKALTFIKDVSSV
jgi:hypothetical protein